MAHQWRTDGAQVVTNGAPMAQQWCTNGASMAQPWHTKGALKRMAHLSGGIERRIERGN